MFGIFAEMYTHQEPQNEIADPDLVNYGHLLHRFIDSIGDILSELLSLIRSHIPRIH